MSDKGELRFAGKRGTRSAPSAPVVPLLIGPDNAIAALGCSWREALSLARQLDVPIVLVGPRTLISARALLEAIDRRSVPAMTAELDPEQIVLARLGRAPR